MVEYFSAHRTQYVMDIAGPIRTGVVYRDGTCHKHATLHSPDGSAKS